MVDFEIVPSTIPVCSIRNSPLSCPFLRFISASVEFESARHSRSRVLSVKQNLHPSKYLFRCTWSTKGSRVAHRKENCVHPFNRASCYLEEGMNQGMRRPNIPSIVINESYS